VHSAANDHGQCSIPTIIGNRLPITTQSTRRYVSAAITPTTTATTTESSGAHSTIPITDATAERRAAVTRLVDDTRRRPNLVRIRPQRHSCPNAQRLVYGSMNVQSVNNKIDDIVAMKRERDLDVLCLCETWHDQDSVSICRLRAEGLQVLECARPRPSDTLLSISTNHGGVALAASRGIRLGDQHWWSKALVGTHMCPSDIT